MKVLIPSQKGIKHIREVWLVVLVVVTVLTVVNPEPRIRSVSPSHNSLVSLLPPKPSHSYSTIQNVRFIHCLVTTAVKRKELHQSIHIHREKNEKTVIFFNQEVNKLSFVNHYYFFMFVIK